MKIKMFIIAAALTAVSCGHVDDGLEHTHSHGHGHEGEHAEAGDEIEMSEEAVEMFGISSQVIVPGDFAEVLVVSGEIAPASTSSAVVTAPVSGVVRYAAGLETGREVSSGSVIAVIDPKAVSGGDSNAAAKAALDAAKRNLDRVSPLYKEGIVSKKDYDAAIAEYEQAKASYSPVAASARATAPIKGVVAQMYAQEGQYVEIGAPIASLNGNVELTLRADVPERYHAMLPQIATANVQLSSSDKILNLSQMRGKRVGSQSDATMRRGYVPVYFSFVNDGSAIPGAMAKVYLVGAMRHDVLTVPVEAISEQQGQYFVYENVDGDCFRKIPVALGASDGERVEVVSGLEPGTDVVTSGVRAVRLAESSTVAPEGHSHNH